MFGLGLVFSGGTWIDRGDVGDSFLPPPLFTFKRIDFCCVYNKYMYLAMTPNVSSSSIRFFGSS